MNDELAARHRAITLRLAGRPVQVICAAVGRSKVWFHKWWDRYLEAGPEGLYDLTRANHHIAQRLSPELERTILSIRRRLQAHATPATRYSLLGATAILAELKTLGIRPLPCERTIERVLERNGLTAPRVRLTPLLPRQEWPGPQARASNELHEVDLVGPVYLKGSGHRYYIWVGKDAFDGAVCLRLASSRRMDEVLWFLGECWKDLGRPEQVQFDNARELSGWGPAARTLSRVIRLCLRYGVSPVFIPEREPQFNGSVENFNGWFQEPLFQRHFQRPGDLRRELARLQEAVNTQHVHPQTERPDPGAAPPWSAVAEAAREFRGADGEAAVGRGARDFYPTGECSRDRHGAEPSVSGGEEASRAVPAVGGGHRARVADGVPEWARLEALALQAVERLTGI